MGKELIPGCMALEFLRMVGYREKVFVKQGNKNNFVHLNLAVNLIAEHHSLQSITLPACSIEALYVISGCDYVSSFFGCTKKKFLDTFLENTSFIFANTNSFIHLDDNSQVTINEDAWMRLITAIYFSKHKAFFRNKTIEQTYTSLVNFPDCEESQRLLSWTGYPLHSISVPTMDGPGHPMGQLKLHGTPQLLQ